MAHRARVMKAWSSQQILRFHYANCKSYNADFDGDEMNMHLPQDEIGRAEAETIVATEYQYLSGTGGAPLRGLIQDHNGIAAILTMRDQLLTRDEYCQFVFAALQSLSRFGYTSANDGSSSTVVGIGRGRAPLLDVQLQPPAIMKPQMRWTGKQVITSLLCSLTAHLPVSARGLNIDGKAKIGDGIWGEASGRKDIIPVGDSQIVVRNNELLVGVLDKNALGNSSYGLIHCVYEAHGPELAGALLSAMGRLLTVYLQHTGITCGVGDLFLTTAADESRKRLIKKAIETGEQAAAAFVGVSPLPQATSAQISSQGNTEWSEKVRLSIRERLRGGVAGADATGEAAILASVSLDNAVKGSMAKAHSAIIDACLPHGLFRTFPSNQFSLMVQSGAKGSLVNHAMIAVGLGQQELEGRRVPTMASNKTLPCFPAFDPHPRSGGYISDRFLTGLRPQDYFFHCQSGREGLIDTAVKTSRSGYLQRCLIKHLEALRIHYDGSVRDSDGGMVSLKYGEDGIDVIATPYITCTDDQLTFLARNFGALTNTFGMMDKNFSKAIKSLDPKSAGEAYIKIVAARSICAESSSKSLSDTTASQLESQMLKLGLEKGDYVEFRLPSNVSSIVSHLQIHRGDDGESMTTSVRGELPRLETSGKKFLRHAEFNSLTPQFIRARIEKIRKSGRGEGGGGADEESSSTLSYDLDFEIALPYESPLLWGSSSSSICNVLLRVKKVPMCTNSSLSKGGLLIIRPLIPDPVDSTHSPFTNVGASSEKLLDRLTGYKARNPHSALRKPGEDKRLSHQAFDVLVSIKAARSQVQPGEPVGVIAAQSIGAEATQMTLNTFHLAGGGGVNVTLGIPRLREILMTASVNPTTPQMTLPLARPLDANHDSNGPQARAVAASISRLLSPLPMADLLAIWRTNDGGIVVSESLRQETGGSRWIREYRARLYVADLDAIQACFGLSFNDVVSACATVFAPRLLKILADDARKTARAAGLVGVAAVSSSSSKGKRKSKEDSIEDDAVIEDDNDNNAIETAQGKGNNKKANKGNKKSTRFSKKSIQDDDDIERGEEKEEEVDEEGGDDEIDGTTAAKEASKKELGGYDDFDAEVQVDEEEEANENKGNGVDTLQEGDDSSSDSSEESSEDEEEEDEEEDVENGVSLKNTKVAVTKKVSKDGTFFVDVPSTVERDARFGGMRANASSNEPWIEVCVVFPASSRKELVLFAAERASKSALVRTVKGVKRAIVARPKIGSEREERTCVMTEGCNIQQMWRLSAELIASNPSMVAAAGTATLSSPTSTIKPTNALSLLKHSDSVVDINRLSSNDINAVLMHYGVEAARMCIVKELRAVFDAYGIGVDVRHLYLIADYMTQGGGFRPMNRAGINAHGSPYLKMSFETCASFLVDALLSNEHERMVSPSARLVVGRVVDSGTGSFDLWAPLNG
jgi:DNA-directed RNA polymerase beta' subunit